MDWSRDGSQLAILHIVNGPPILHGSQLRMIASGAPLAKPPDPQPSFLGKHRQKSHVTPEEATAMLLTLVIAYLN